MTDRNRRRNEFLKFRSKHPDLSKTGGGARTRIQQANTQSRNMLRVAPQVRAQQPSQFGAAVAASAQ